MALGIGYGIGAAYFLLVFWFWLWFAIARAWLAVRGRLPWALMSFLADAHQRGVLRRVGTAYHFRHLELQRWLATRR